MADYELKLLAPDNEGVDGESTLENMRGKYRYV